MSAAQEFLGKRELVVDNKKFNYDCSGLVRAVYYRGLGIDLFNVRKNEPGTKGVEVVYRYCRENGKIYGGKTPNNGDMVFFKNTYYSGREENFLSHVGVVEKTDKRGTITFIHLGSEGITRAKMNLKEPHSRRDDKMDEELNSYIRKKTGKEPSRAKYFSGELFNSFGTIFK